MTTGHIGRTAVKLATVGLVLLTVPACQDDRPVSPGSAAPSTQALALPSSSPVAGAPVSPLDRLIVAPDGPMAGYARARFGQPWKDTDRNGCNQREDVLVRDAGSVARDEKRRCQVIAISLLDPYTGETLTEVSKIQVDHVVSLGAAWRAGAAGWSPIQRELFATDKTNLLAVKGKINERKSDDPPEKFKHLIQRGSWCRVASIYVAVSETWRLTITPATRNALTEMLGTCQ
jgi:hypothetical protein